ncbi:hypothetical protein Afil01_09640 [Actinorhabdospora filicis]|uniref:Uncharacterized protein n=1 Tax=Actinorhabdospora filicis TaxID=1785913 RepID=A0A9W6SHY4_9ACTN|nr:hypothetical protein Afil01_09640 [Actinorhabdospora filicis]
MRATCGLADPPDGQVKRARVPDKDESAPGMRRVRVFHSAAPDRLWPLPTAPTTPAPGADRPTGDAAATEPQRAAGSARQADGRARGRKGGGRAGGRVKRARVPGGVRRAPMGDE